jgi:hypothetical protein
VAFYLVERYVPSVSAGEIARSVAHLAHAAGDDVRHLYTLLVLGEDTCLSLFEALGAEAVEEANERAGFPLDRIVQAAVFEGEW